MEHSLQNSQNLTKNKKRQLQNYANHNYMCISRPTAIFHEL